MCVWIIGEECTPPGSCAHYLAKRVEKDTPFSPGLRQASIRAIEHIWGNELKVLGLDTVHWLNCLDINVDDIEDGYRWVRLLVDVINSPKGLESLSSHYWHLLDKLVVGSKLYQGLVSCNMEVMRTLEEAEDWERLGAWMVVVWSFLPLSDISVSESMEGIEEVTLNSLLQQPLALPRFEDLCEAGTLSYNHLIRKTCRTS